MDMTFFKQYYLVILGVCVAMIVVMVLVVKLYKQFIQKLLVYKKKLGKINSLLIKLFKANAINEIYIDFYKSLSLWQKVKFVFAQKTLYLDSSIKTTNDYGISFKLIANECRFYINPETLVNSELTESDILCLFSKVFKGKIDLVAINIPAKSAQSDLIKPINDCFGYMARYLSSSFKYIVNITESEDDIPYQVWSEYRNLIKLNNFWNDEKSSARWFNKVTNKYSDNQLCLGKNQFTSEQIKDLYYFLNNCLNQEHFINLLQTKVSNKIAKYKGFGINLSNTRAIQKFYTNKKLSIKVKKLIYSVLIIGLTAGFIAGWYSIKDHIVISNHKLSAKEINLKNYYQSLDSAYAHNATIELAYFNGVKTKLDQSWLTLIKPSVIDKAINDANNPVQKLALNITKSDVANPNIKKLIADNSWLWSKVTNIPEDTLNVWLEIKHTIPNQQSQDKLSFDKPDHIQTIQEVEIFIKDIFGQNDPLELNLDSLKIDKALRLKIFDLLVANKDIISNLKLSKINTNLALTSKDRVILNHFSTYLELRELILPILNSKNLTDRVNLLEELNDSIKPLINTSWDKNLVSFLLQSISDKFYLSYDNYDYVYYEKHIAPLNLNLVESASKYKALGIDINAINTQFKSSLDKYFLAYNNFYSQKLVESFEVDVSNVEALLSRLGEVNNQSNIKPLLSDIEKNILVVEDPLFLQKGFKGFNDFSKLYKGYHKLISEYIKTLNNAKEDPKILIGLYQSNKHPFISKMNKFIKTIKVTPKVKQLLSQAAVATETVTSQMLQDYTQQYWSKHLEPIYGDVFNSFPFKKDANDQIKVNDLTEMVGKDGLFWQHYVQIEQLIKKYPNNHWLASRQFKHYQKIKELLDTLWDSNGKPKAIEFTLNTSELLPKYEYTQRSWLFFKTKKQAYYDGVLSIDKNTISNIGVGGIKQTFKIDWWHDNIASVVLVNNKKNLIAQHTEDSLWSFWKLLIIAKQRNNNFIWSFNHNQTQVMFDINYSDIWFN